MSWFDVKRGRLNYRGRVSRAPLTEWFSTKEGATRVAEAATSAGFRLFASARTRRALWKALDRAARSESVREALQVEADQFAKVLGQACYAPALPRMQVALHRLVIVPRALVAARARSGVRQRLWNLPPLETVDDAVRAFFCEQLLVQLDRAIERASPSASRPVQGADGWSCIGSDRPYVWVDPLWAGADWSGHLFMFEFPRTSLTGAQRKELDAAVRQLQQGLGGLSRLQRDAIVRRAADGLAAGSYR
jgi:hypothetical protein